MKVVGTIAGLILEELYFRKSLNDTWIVKKTKNNQVVIEIDDLSDPYTTMQAECFIDTLERKLNGTNYELVREDVCVFKDKIKLIVRKEQ